VAVVMATPMWCLVAPLVHVVSPERDPEAVRSGLGPVANRRWKRLPEAAAAAQRSQAGRACSPGSESLRSGFSSVALLKRRSPELTRGQGVANISSNQAALLRSAAACLQKQDGGRLTERHRTWISSLGEVGDASALPASARSVAPKRD